MGNDDKATSYMSWKAPVFIILRVLSAGLNSIVLWELSEELRYSRVVYQVFVWNLISLPVTSIIRSIRQKCILTNGYDSYVNSKVAIIHDIISLLSLSLITSVLLIMHWLWFPLEAYNKLAIIAILSVGLLVSIIYERTVLLLLNDSNIVCHKPMGDGVCNLVGSLMLLLGSSYIREISLELASTLLACHQYVLVPFISLNYYSYLTRKAAPGQFNLTELLNIAQSGDILDSILNTLNSLNAETIYFMLEWMRNEVPVLVTLPLLG